MPSRFAAAPIIFKQSVAPDNTSDYGPTLGDIWVDTSSSPPITKKCTAMYPFTWTSIEGGGGGSVPGGSPTQIQYNNAGSFGGISTLTTNGTVVTATVGSDLLLIDPTDTTKKFNFDASNIATATQRTVNIPNANSTTIQSNTSSAHNFLTAVSAQGVISTAQPAFSDLSGSLAATQLPAFTGDVSSSAGSNSLTVIGIQTKSIDAPTTLGDIFVYNGTSIKRLGVGSNTQVLTADSTQPTGIKWAAGGGGTSFDPNDQTILYHRDDFMWNYSLNPMGELTWLTHYSNSNSSAAQTTSADPNLGILRITTTAANGNGGNQFIAGGIGDLKDNIIWQQDWVIRLQQITDVRVTYGAMDSISYPPNNGIYFRFDTNLSDTTWKVVTINGGTSTLFDTTQTVAINTWYHLRLKAINTTEVRYAIFDGAGNILKAEAVASTTNIPSANLQEMWNLFNDPTVTAAASADIDFYAFKKSTVR